MLGMVEQNIHETITASVERPTFINTQGSMVRTRASESDLVQIEVRLPGADNIAPAAKATECQCPHLYNADHYHVIELKYTQGVRLTLDG